MSLEAWLAFCVYTWVGPTIFQKQLQREMAPENLVSTMFLAAFGRSASHQEVQATLQFAREQRQKYAALVDGLSETQIRQSVWADVAHVLFNSAEFIYVR